MIFIYPGNWEVVYYKENMLKLMGGLNAPKICTNMYHDLGDGKKGELIFPPYYTWNTAGIKIGFVSYTDPLVPIRQSPAYSKGIIYTFPEENLAHYVKVLKRAGTMRLYYIAFASWIVAANSTWQINRSAKELIIFLAAIRMNVFANLFNVNTAKW